MIKFLVLLSFIWSEVHSNPLPTFRCEGAVTTITDEDAIANPDYRIYGYDDVGVYIESFQVPCNTSPSDFKENSGTRFIVCRADHDIELDKLGISIEIDRITSGIFNFRLTDKRVKLGSDSIVNFQGLCSYADS